MESIKNYKPTEIKKYLLCQAMGLLKEIDLVCSCWLSNANVSPETSETIYTKDYMESIDRRVNEIGEILAILAQISDEDLTKIVKQSPINAFH